MCLGKGLECTTDFLHLKRVDMGFICVPTPLGKHREPDLSYIIDTVKVVSKYLHSEELIILKSTTYPGTTDEIALPILQKNGLKVGSDFYLSYSPEREDPGNKKFSIFDIPIVAGGYTIKCRDLACAV